jgi:hypothetical protein
MSHQLPKPVVDAIQNLLNELALLGYVLVSSRYSPESFGNFIVELKSSDGRLAIVRDRSQYYLGETDDVAHAELKRAGMFQAFDDVQSFQTAVLSFIRNRRT